MKAIKMMLLAGLLMLPFVSQADEHERCWTGGTAICAANLQDVGAAIDAAWDAGWFTSKRAESDYSNLCAKLAAAGAKLNLGKDSNAVDKLGAISDKATDLVDPPRGKKSKLEDATAINNAVTNAITCIGGL